MRSHISSLNHHCYSRLGLLRSPIRQSFTGFVSLSRHCSGASYSYYALKLNRSGVRTHTCSFRRGVLQVRAVDEDSYDISSLDNWNDNEDAEYMLSLSGGEDVDIVFPVSDLDLPTARVSNDEVLTLAAHRLAMTGRGCRRHSQDLPWGVTQPGTFCLLGSSSSICRLLGVESCQTTFGAILLDSPLPLICISSFMCWLCLCSNAQES